MRVETVCTGDELLTGLTSDTNSRFFQELLLDRTGLSVRRGVVVGDVPEDIIEALKAAATRADVVLVSGGLGPTTDDLTAECAAKAQGVPLVESPEVWAHIEARFQARGVALTPNNRRQAQVPQGAEVVLNQEGSAPLFIQRLGDATVFYVPGVPKEYRHLVEAHVVPRIATLLASRGAPPPIQLLRRLRTVGLPESHLDMKIRPLMERHPAVTFGYRTRAPENELKLLARGASADEAQAALAKAETEARAVLGRACFGADDDTLETVVGRALSKRAESLAVAESCTAGLVVSQLARVPGASGWLRGGAVAYVNEVKVKLAAVDAGLLAKHDAVSQPVGQALAEGIRKQLGSTWGVGVTGYAGPSGGTSEAPVGTVFVSVAGPLGTVNERHRFSGDRERVRSFAAAAALDLLRRSVSAAPERPAAGSSSTKG